jgi:hypothetical protein
MPGILHELREVQLPILAVLLLGGCVTKLARAVRLSSTELGLGPTALFPVRLRRPMALAVCAVECGLGVGLIVTAGRFGSGTPAALVRFGATLLFLVATTALIEMRTIKPDVGCGCFGDFSTAPVSGRTLTRSALLAAAAASTILLRPIQLPAGHSRAAAELIIFMLVELAFIGALSPEVGEALVRLGYSEPCELKAVPPARTLLALQRSKQWRRHSGVLSSDEPIDVWRELCWRYFVYQGAVQGREVQVVFAVFLQPRRPAVHVALVDAPTGQVLPWPAPPSRPSQVGRLLQGLGTWQRDTGLGQGEPRLRQGEARLQASGSMPFSSDL